MAQSSPTSPPSEKVKTCLLYWMSLIRRFRTKVDTKDCSRDSQHQNVGKYSSRSTGRDLRTLYVVKMSKYHLQAPGSTLIPVEWRVVSAVDARKLNYSDSVVEVDKEKYYKAGHHHGVLIVEFLAYPQN